MNSESGKLNTESAFPLKAVHVRADLLFRFEGILQGPLQHSSNAANVPDMYYPTFEVLMENNIVNRRERFFLDDSDRP